MKSIHRIAFFGLLLSAVSHTGPTLCAAQQAIPADEGAAVVDWQSAADHYGETCTVVGKVVATKALSNWCFLNFDADYRTTFTIAIPKHCYDRFPEPPEKFYLNKQVRVFGEVREFKGKPEIVLCDPANISVTPGGEGLPSRGDETNRTPDLPSTAAPPRRITPRPVARPFDGTCLVASFNVLNLFDDDDDPYHTDEGTPPKPRSELEGVARTIREINADVLALQEVENRGYLERFVRAMLPDMGYAEIVLVEGNDRRGIDTALLSRFPVGPVTSYRHLRIRDPKGAVIRFRRDLLRVQIAPPDVPPFDVFVVHLKSKHGGDSPESLNVRLAEAGAIRQIIDGMLVADVDARFLICGDFNDTIDSQPLQDILGTGAGALTSFHNDAPQESRITYNRDPYRTMIDFILASPGMAKTYVPQSFRILPGSQESSGSDHNAIGAKFKLR